MLDLSASLGLGQLTIGMHDESGYAGDVWHYALMRILVAARVNGLLAIDGPFAAFGDLDGLERSARRTAETFAPDITMSKPRASKGSRSRACA